MLITILFVAMLIIGISFIGIGWYIYNRYNERYWCIPLGIIVTIISSVCLSPCIVLILAVQVPRQKNYEQALYEKQIIEYRIEKEDENIVGNELLYNDIVEFNNELRINKNYSNNIWLNWFYNDKIATIEYIEIPGINIENKGNIC